MKKLIVLLTLLLMSTQSFSQNGLTPYPKQISESEFVIDLSLIKKLNYFKVDCDYFRNELEIQRKLVFHLEQKSVVQDTIISTQEKEIGLYKTLVNSKEQQIDVYKQELKVQKRKNFGNKLLLYGSLLLSGYLIVK